MPINRIIVVSPHPDDETLGCGGSLLRHLAEGDQIHWLIMSTINQDSGFSKERIEVRSKEITQVANSFNFSSLKQADFTTTQLDKYPKSLLINTVSEVFHRIKPNIVYLPYRSDVHSDHTAVFDAVAACTKSFRYPYIKKVRAYETLSETEFSINPGDRGFKPNLWIDVSKYLDQKIEIMKIYSGELQEHPFPRSEKAIRALASFRGIVSGDEYAESFMILKETM